ncbi:nuclear transport factor 2 family protein [Mucilaginibacter sp. OK098]|uniref:nuclear transport factor 2 family protein n=1 Tax=Mucilaginibacter sp. OK098 TaxID=1855297 RepID=UPI00091F8355|nr:nuclear transport factor 2 family protein [Mucilaginibacter sp. OK098]SHM75622.1 SnoaL-like domain-containing protein [Mucilaginibacter sp. OK098]
MKNVTIILLFITQAFSVKSQSVPDSVTQLNSNEFRNYMAIRQLVDSFAYYADRTNAQRQAALFVENGTLEIYRSEPDTSKPVFVLKGRKQLEEVFNGLKKYDMTFHLNGQNSIKFGDDTTGTVQCLAHHIFFEDGKRTLQTEAIRYYDTYTRQNNLWLFVKRKLVIYWEDKRLSTP